MEYSNTSILWRVIVLILVVIGWYFLYHKTTALPVQKVTVERLSKTYWINQPIQHLSYKDTDNKLITIDLENPEVIVDVPVNEPEWASFVLEKNKLGVKYYSNAQIHLHSAKSLKAE